MILDLMGTDQYGGAFAAVLQECCLAAGSGAGASGDGIDTGGVTEPEVSIPNVENNEFRYPILYLYRRQRRDSGGPGEFRGGVGVSMAFIPHDADGIGNVMIHSHGVGSPSALGLAGGYPAATNRLSIRRKTNLDDLFRRGVMPAEVSELKQDAIETPPSFTYTKLGRGDVFECVGGGGGGFGDPLNRAPESVLTDVQNRLVSPEQARGRYGVAFRKDDANSSIRTQSRPSAPGFALHAKPIPTPLRLALTAAQCPPSAADAENALIWPPMRIVSLLYGIMPARWTRSPWITRSMSCSMSSGKPAPVLRDLHRIFPGGQLLRHPSIRPLARGSAILPVLHGHGGIGNHALGLLDHGQQQLDAGAGRLCGRERRLRSGRLGQDPLQPGGLGKISAYAAGVISYRRLLRRGDRCLVPAARQFAVEARIMLRMGLFLAAILVPVQILFGHLTGDYVHDYQPAKFAAIEARWHDEQPASEVLIALPDPGSETNRYAISIPILGSLIGSMSFDSKEVGLTDFRPEERPPVVIPFFTFRIMVGCGLVMLLLAWVGSYLSLKGRLEQNRLLLWAIFLSFPLPFIATLTGWFTAEVGRQPWVVYGVLRTAEAMTPFLTARAATISLVVFCALYSFIFLFGALYIYRLLRRGPEGRLARPPVSASPNRPMSVVDGPLEANPQQLVAGE